MAGAGRGLIDSSSKAVERNIGYTVAMVDMGIRRKRRILELLDFQWLKV